MRENIVPFESRNKPANTSETGNNSQFDTAETVDDLLIDYVIPTSATESATDEIYEEIDMTTAMKPVLPAKLTKEDFQVWNIVDRKKRLAAETGQIVPGINDGPILRPLPLTEKDYNSLLIPTSFKGDGSEFTAEEILKRKQQLIEEYGLNVPGVEPVKVNPVIATPSPRVVTPTDFTPEGIAKAKAEYFTTHPGEFPVDEIVAVDEVLRRNGQISASAFNKAALQDQYEDNERRRLGLRDPHDSRVLASTENFFDSTQTDTAVAGYQRINTLRAAPTAPSQPEQTVTVHMRKPTSDAFVRTGNLINPNATRLNPDDFPRYGPRAVIPQPKGNQPVEAKQGFFKRLVPKFISRFWNR